MITIQKSGAQRLFDHLVYSNKNCCVHSSNDLSFFVNLSDKLQALENKVIEKNIWTLKTEAMSENLIRK